MFINKNYKARHLLLKVLFDYDEKLKPDDNLETKNLHFNKICEQLPQYDRSLLLDNLDYLSTTKEIHCSMQGEKSTFFILSSGSHSYRQRKYIRDGVKDQINYIYDIV